MKIAPPPQRFDRTQRQDRIIRAKCALALFVGIAAPMWWTLTHIIGR